MFEAEFDRNLFDLRKLAHEIREGTVAIAYGLIRVMDVGPVLGIHMLSSNTHISIALTEEEAQRVNESVHNEFDFAEFLRTL